MTRTFWLVCAVLALAVPRADAQVPNMKATVDAVYASARWDLTTKAGSGCFTEAVAHRLHALDADWGHLAKFGGQNQWNGHAVDAILHKSGYAVDIIGSSESPKASPRWGIDRDAATGKPIARYTNNKYFVVPTRSCAPSDAPGGPTTPPPPSGELDAIRAEIVALRASYAVLEADLAAARNALGALQVALDDERRARAAADEATAEQALSAQRAAEALGRDVQELRSRPIPDGCVARFTSCRLTFNAP